MFKKHSKPFSSPMSGLTLKGHCCSRMTGYCIDMLQTSTLFISCPVACPYHLRQARWIIFTSLAWQQNAKRAEVQRSLEESSPWIHNLPPCRLSVLCVCVKEGAVLDVFYLRRKQAKVSFLLLVLSTGFLDLCTWMPTNNPIIMLSQFSEREWTGWYSVTFFQKYH